MRAEEVEDLPVSTGLGADAIVEIGAVEAGDVAGGVAELELVGDVLADALGGRGGERHEGDLREAFAELGNLPILGAEIVAPLADAVRLINGEEVHAPTFEIGEHPREHEAFGRGVEEAELAVVQAAQAGASLVGVEGGIQERRRDAAGGERVHLVFHQRDEGRDDDGEAAAGERGELETQRLAAAGGQQGDHVLARERVADDLLLQRAEAGVAEVLLQQREQIGRVRHRCENGRKWAGEKVGKWASIRRWLANRRVRELPDAARRFPF